MRIIDASGAKRAMKVYPADPKTGEFSTPDLIAELCATRDLPRHANIKAYDKVWKEKKNPDSYCDH